VNKGSLLTDMVPAVNPPAEIDDPRDFKPADWDEREKIADPEATKPESWDEDAPPQIFDKAATKPEGWLDDEPDNVPDPNAEKPEDWYGIIFSPSQGIFKHCMASFGRPLCLN